MVRDIPKNYIYNAFIISKRKNPFLLKIIEKIAANIQNRYYGDNPLWITGPGCIGQVAMDNPILSYNLDLVHIKGGGFIELNNEKYIKTRYPQYDQERPMRTHYSKIWEKRQVYKDGYGYINTIHNKNTIILATTVPTTIGYKEATKFI